MTAFRCLSLKSDPGALLPRFPSYAFASAVQTALQQEFLAWKASPTTSRGPAPPPAVISFTPTPTYTLGRRQTEPLSVSEVARLRSPLFVPSLSAAEEPSISDNPFNGAGKKASFFLPTITHAPRGGLTTYHGPGQLVIWPVIDLHSPLHPHLSVRDYACLLEKTTIATLKRVCGLSGFTTDNPGVWVRSSASHQGQDGGDERKIAALGVHLRRHVTSLGIAINYSTPVTGPAETNPWGRIVACGIGDRGVTSVQAELVHGNDTPQDDDAAILATLSDEWQVEFQQRLKVQDSVGFDMDQSMEHLGSYTRDRDDFLLAAHPISNLET